MSLIRASSVTERPISKLHYHPLATEAQMMMLSASFHRKGCNNQGCAYDQTELNRRVFDFTPDVSMFQLIHCSNRMHYRIQCIVSCEKNLDRLAFQLCKLLPRSGNEFSCSLLIIRELQMCTDRTKHTSDQNSPSLPLSV